MGAGKTSAMINYMNAMPENEKVIYCTPYIDETKRIARCCGQKQVGYIDKNVYDGRKTTDLENRIAQGQNISCTHELLSRLNDRVLEDIRRQNYTLVIDEAYNVVCTVHKSAKKSLEYLLRKNIITIDENTGHISFASQYDSEACPHYQNKIDEYIRSGHAYFTSGKVFISQFPIDVLNTFKRIIVMTYMFESQIIYYYLMINGYHVNYIGARRTSGGDFELCLPEQADGFRYNIAEKIHIYDGEKLDSIGNERNSLSSGWFKRNRNNSKNGVGQLGRNYANLQKNIWKCSAKDFMWTCFGGDKDRSDGIDKLIADANPSIAKGYVPCNARAENKYSNRHYLAFGINWFGHPDLYNYFKSKGYEMDMNGWALSMMLQWIWRSAIRNGEDIYIYVPSKKMRTLLTDWIAKQAEGGGAVEGQV